MWEKGPGLFLCLIAGVDREPKLPGNFKIIYIDLDHILPESRRSGKQQKATDTEKHTCGCHLTLKQCNSFDSGSSKPPTLYKPSAQENWKRHFSFNKVTSNF